jgi:hypothetical protein
MNVEIRNVLIKVKLTEYVDSVGAKLILEMTPYLPAKRKKGSI